MNVTVRPIWALVGIATSLLLITGAGLVYTRQVQHTTTAIERTQAEQAATRKEVLCPLYGVFLASYNPDSPQAKADPDRYEAAFDVIRHGNQVLGCLPLVKR